MVHVWYATIFDSHGRVIALNHGCTSTELHAFFSIWSSDVAMWSNLKLQKLLFTMTTMTMSITIDDERLACWCRSVAETIDGGKWATLIGSPLKFTSGQMMQIGPSAGFLEVSMDHKPTVDCLEATALLCLNSEWLAVFESSCPLTPTGREHTIWYLKLRCYESRIYMACSC